MWLRLTQLFFWLFSCDSSQSALATANNTAKPKPNTHVKYHIINSLSCLVEGLVVGGNVVTRDFACHDAISPSGVPQNNGGKDEGHPEHDRQRVVA